LRNKGKRRSHNPTKNFMEKNQTIEKAEYLKAIQSMLKALPIEAGGVTLEDLKEIYAQ
jgi:hypothetical protein